MIVACRNRSRPIAEATHIDWRRAGGSGTITQLADTIPTPTLDTPRRCQRTGMKPANRDYSYTVAEVTHIDWCQAGGGGTIAQLALSVIAPTLDAPRRSYGTGMVVACRNGRHTVVEATHIDRCQAGGSGTITQLTICVIAPTLDAAYRSQGTGVYPTYADRSHTAAEATHIDRRQAGRAGTIT